MSRTAQQILETLGEDLPQTLFSAIQEAANVAIEDMKNRLQVGPDATGALKSSIEAIVNESDLSLGLIMNEYGYFQNFGVHGVKDKGTTQMGLDEPVAEAFGASEGDTMSFGTGNYSKGGKPWGAYYSGLNAKNFIQLETFLTDIEAHVKQNLEL